MLQGLLFSLNFADRGDQFPELYSNCIAVILDRKL